MTAEVFKENILPMNRKLLGFANRFMQDIDDSKDIVQDIYIKLWNMRNDLGKYNSIEALAMKMTRNLCLDKIKLKKTVTLNGIVKEEVSDDVLVNEQQTEIKIAAQRAKNAIKKLDEPQKTIMQLRDIEGYDYEEIAQILNMNINTIRVSLSRARKKVREFLLNKYYNHGSEKSKSSVREIL
ncbi:MAG: sigma-70 family RNA polymerase sigma factor [Bacteroidales bacterium]|jgi:RNA polymerase sigma-70 factor (ECF subfamily)|nr:sigma-70 family RNA polymerase sigma factor [Bacteroidales bacterium]